MRWSAVLRRLHKWAKSRRGAAKLRVRLSPSCPALKVT